MSVTIAFALTACAVGAQNAPRITAVDADSRGRIFITVDEVMAANTINSTSIIIKSPGADDRIGTADDAAVPRDVVFNFATKEIRIFAQVEAGAPYSIFLDGDIIKDDAGRLLDGEFNGPNTPSGDGAQGGDYLAYAKLPAGANPVVRFSTLAGDIEVEMFADETPLTVANFSKYMNDGVYDQTFFHRSVENFVIQGGGFFSDDLAAIPTKPAVNNEPGISNTRGTIAMAKQPNNPNSATNQFFFNLKNNGGPPANLDTQNGGFTVFGEITGGAGLAVMDDIADFPVVDATAQGSAFDELPVLDADAVTDPEGDVTVAFKDLITIDRVAAIYSLTADPFVELTPQQTTVLSASGDAEVLLIGLSGTAPGSAFIDVKFTKTGDDITQIILHDPFPSQPVGIQIVGAGSVKTITDKRKNPSGPGLAFIASSAPIGSITLADGPHGHLLNDVLMPDGSFMPPDIDDDGMISDTTSIFIEQGLLKSFWSKGDVSGDIASAGGASSIKVDGTLADADIALGAPNKQAKLAIKVGDAIASSIIAPKHHITNIQAKSWTDSTAPKEFTADAISAIKIGAKNASGDFEADINIPEGKAPLALGTVAIAGDASGSWVIDGNMNSVTVNGDGPGLLIAAMGNINSIKTGNLSDAFIGTTKSLNTLQTKSWDGGILDCATINGVIINGDFNADLNIQGLNTKAVDLANFAVAGNCNDANLFVGGGLGKMLIKGVASDFVLTIQGQCIGLQFGEVFNGTVNSGQEIPIITAGRWEGGKISTPEMTALNITGTKDDPGNLEADIDINFIDKIFTGKEGNFSGTLDCVMCEEFIITGDMENATINIGNTFTKGLVVLDKLFVGDRMVNSKIRATGIVVSVDTWAMIDSMLNVGGPAGLTEFPASPSQVDALGRITELLVGGLASNEPLFNNSFVITTHLTEAYIGGVSKQAGGPFGVGAVNIGHMEFKGPGVPFHVLDKPTKSPPPQEDFEVRVNFAEPTG